MTDRTVVYRLRAEATSLISGMKASGAAVSDTASKMTLLDKQGDKTRRGLDTLGDRAGVMGLAAAGGIAAITKAAIDWESAWAGVTKTVDGSAAQMAELEEGLRGLATTLPATHEEIAGVAEAAGQLGVAREDILDFTKTMIDLGETTNLTAEDAATNIAQIANVMGTTGDEIDNFGAALVALGNDGASTEAQILDMTQRIAGAGAQIGLAETDILAIANAAASMGIEAEAGGSAISRVFTELAKATSSGGPKLEQFAEIAGMTAQEFTTAFGDDPAQAFRAFTEGLDRVNKSGGDVFSTLKQVGFSDVRVSQALLGMAASGDLLADSLDLGKQAWQDNTALAIEAAKRYDTTSSEIQVSWNRIKDSGIEAGEALLPVVAGVAETVGDMADAFGSLPGPVQNSLTGLLGITAVFGGGLWFTSKVVGGVADMKGALDDLGFSGDKTSGALGKVGRAAGVAAAGLAALSIVDQMQRQFEGLDTGMAGVTKSLLELADGTATRLGGEFENLADSFDRLTDPNGAQAFQDSIYDTFGFLGSDSRVDEAVGQFEALDAAMANLVTSGAPDQAREAFASLAASLGLTGAEQRDLLDLMPTYTDALDGAEVSSQLAADAADDQATATDGLAAAMADAEAAAEDFKDLMDSLNAVLSGRGEIRDYEAALDDFRKALKENGNTFDVNTAKGRDNQAMLDGIAASALAVADEMSQADRRKFLTGAIKDLRTMGQELDLPKSEVKALIELLRAANDADVNPKIDVDTAQSLARIQAVRNSIENLRDRNLTITTTYKVVGNAADSIPYRGEADGGVLDFYAAGGIREQHVAQIAPAGSWRVWAEPETGGEAYIPLASSKRERSIDIWEEVGQRLGVDFMRFAKGGTTGGKKNPPKTSLEFVEAFVPGMSAVVAAQLEATQALFVAASDQAAAARNQLEAAEGAEAAAREQQEAAESQLRATEAQRDAFGSQVRGNFERDPFGSGFNAAIRSLTQDTKGASGFEDLLRQLEALGLDGAAYGALAASGDAATARGMLSRGVEGVNLFESAYGGREAALGSLSTYAAENQFAEAIAAQTAQLAAATTAQDQAAARVAELSGSVWALGQNVTTLENQLGALTDAMVNRSDRPINVFEARTPLQTAREIARHERAGV